ncbi:MAG TPA: hypothetical protein VLJ59_18395 [Mycobacteriales bacterium]|nr:hypothetical protein [Mycobacteriales bacterium]
MRRRTAATAALLGTVLGGCTATPALPSTAVPADPSATAVAGPSPGGSPAACPGRYVDPDPHRPRIILTFDVSADLSTVTGTEQVRFRPDRPIREVVFRLTANGPTSYPNGTSITVRKATADPAGGRFRYEPAGAAPGSPGGVLAIPLATEVPAGQEVLAEVAFTLKLGQATFERFGREQGTAWFGSGQPLFAWERGVGWHREPLARWTGESATSEASTIDLTVTAPTSLVVMASGVADPPVGLAGGRRSWHTTSASARDVSVAVGNFRTVQATVGGAQLTVGALEAAEARSTLAEISRGMTELARRFGPFPFPALNVTVLPAPGGGIEYPGSILLFGSSRLVDVHETAHQWFYALVGDSQFRDPWLDEAFATYAEELVNISAPGAGVDVPGDVGKGINDFPDAGSYYGTVYYKGAAALFEARRRAGPEQFDRAIRCYVNANAWRIAHPENLAAALAGLPAALAVLRAAHALP